MPSQVLLSRRRSTHDQRAIEAVVAEFGSRREAESRWVTDRHLARVRLPSGFSCLHLGHEPQLHHHARHVGVGVKLDDLATLDAGEVGAHAGHALARGISFPAIIMGPVLVPVNCSSAATASSLTTRFANPSASWPSQAAIPWSSRRSISSLDIGPLLPIRYHQPTPTRRCVKWAERVSAPE